MDSVNNSQTNEYPIMTVLARNPLMASAISKAVEQPSNAGASTIRDAETGAMASLGEMHQVSRLIQQEIQNYESFFQLFPDMNIDRLIVGGAILAPNNMFREDLNFSIENDLVGPVVSSQILQIVEEEIDRKYGFIQELRTIVDNALFNRGSHVKLVLPESAVDYLINNNRGMRLESVGGLRKYFDQKTTNFSLGLLTNPKKKGDTTYRQESYEKGVDEYDPLIKSADNVKWAEHPKLKEIIDLGLITIGDDFGKLKLPYYQRTFSREMVRDRLDSQRKGISTYRAESVATTKGIPDKANTRITTVTTSDEENVEGTVNIDRLRKAIFKAAPTEHQFFQRVPRVNNLLRHSIGPCLYIDAPSEAFVPIHYPGQPNKHLGYLGLIDPSTGYFITLDSQKQHLSNFSANSNVATMGSTGSAGGNNNMASSLTGKAAQNLTVGDQTGPLRFHPEIFGSLVVEDFLSRIDNGMNGFEVEAKMTSTLAYVMMARSNAGRQTQVIYLPIDFVSYFAFDHNANGTGRSLLAPVQNLLSLRAAALYSRVANQIRNAISITDVHVVLDERDHRPNHTLMKIVDLVTQSRAQFFPWGLNTASDIWSWWNRAGYQLNVEGHPAIPKTKVTYEHRAHDHHVPDIADDSYLADMIGHHFGITPEMKDAGKGADFATSIVNNNILFANRALAYQQKLNPQITDHVRRLVFNDSDIFSKVRKVIKDNWTETISKFDDQTKVLYEGVSEEEGIDAFMRVVTDSLKAILPPPEVTTIQNQSAAFKEFSEAIDFAAEQCLNDEAMAKTIFGEDAVAAIEMLATSKAQIKRNWMLKNGYLPELFDIASLDQDKKPNSKLLIEGNEFTLAFGKNVVEALRAYKAVGLEVTKDIGILSGVIPPEVESETDVTQPTNPEDPSVDNQDPDLT